MLLIKDHDLVQIVDNALAEATAKARKDDGSSWLACRPGCTSCCHGVFRISRLDAERLRAAWNALQTSDPVRAAEVLRRAENSVHALETHFPGDPMTGLLSEDEEAWDRFADLPEADIACPALDPKAGTCDLYTGRPLTCRIFGPPVVQEQGIGVCELFYCGADDDTISANQMLLAHHELEADLDRQLPPGTTIVSWALHRETRSSF